jgi:outer membrane immunogenic protein
MRTGFLATVALCALAMSGPVLAADMPARGPAPVFKAFQPAPFSWSGFYIGLYGGAGWGDHDRSNTAGFNNSYKSSGGLIGGLAGYNWQLNNPVVLGVEGDIAWANIKGDDGGAGGSVDQSHFRWLGSVRGRVGYAFDNWLPFITGGWAFANIRHTNDFGAGDSFDNARSGWTLGGGIEYAVTPNWTTRLDYRYFDFGSYSNAAPANGVFPYSVSNKLQTVTVGLSYKF